MWSDLSLPWQAALEQAWEAWCCGCIPIGCVIANPAGEIVARGRNRIDEHIAPPRQVCDSQLAHAELNALLSAPNPLPNRHECTLYTTMEPCPLCMGALYMSGVRGLHYACRDTYAGSANLLGSTPYYSRKTIRVCAPQNAALETILLAMCFAYYLGTYPPLGISIVETEWVKTVPAGVELGRALHQQGILERLRSEAVPAAVAIDRIAALVPLEP